MAQTESVTSELRTLFVKSESKRVSKTDKSKGAYVLTKAQVEVLSAAGLTIAAGSQLVEIRLIGEAANNVTASYYHSIREGAERAPEPRMGREFISTWLDTGDDVTIATDGVDLFAFRAKHVRAAELPQQLVRSAVRRISDSRLRQLLPEAGAPVPRTTKPRAEFVRSPAVIELALRRAMGRCEFPRCTAQLFESADGEVYLEVHHIDWLRHGGTDSLDNVAALCPRCHRALHSAVDRSNLKDALKEHLRNR